MANLIVLVTLSIIVVVAASADGVIRNQRDSHCMELFAFTKSSIQPCFIAAQPQQRSGTATSRHTTSTNRIEFGTMRLERGARRQSTIMHSTAGPPIPPKSGSFSYIEGDEYSNDLEELEAMGGDPAFFGLNNDIGWNVPPAEAVADGYASAIGGGSNLEIVGDDDSNPSSDVKWEWDGVVDEEAHLGYD